VVVAETHETAKAHDRVGHASGQLVDDEVIDLTDIPAMGSIDRRYGVLHNLGAANSHPWALSLPASSGLG
jgi:hypothetical protein